MVSITHVGSELTDSVRWLDIALFPVGRGECEWAKPPPRT